MVDLYWRNIWEQKGCHDAKNPNDGALAAMAGRDPETFDRDDRCSKWLKDCLNRDQKKILEVGCGSGLYIDQLSGATVHGNDLSLTMVSHLKSRCASLSLLQCIAWDLPYLDESFDVAFSNSVYMFFPNENRAEKAFREMVRVIRPGGSGAVIDVHDEDKRSAYEKYKLDTLGEEEFLRRKENGLVHLHLSKDWFRVLADELHLNMTILDEDPEVHATAHVKYDVFFTK